MPRFLYVALFLLFVFVLISILGINQFSGVLYGRCRYNPIPENATFWNKSFETAACSRIQDDGHFTCKDGHICGFPGDFGISLEDDGVYNNKAINYGVTNFDNLGSALFSVFQITTLESWKTTMYNLINSNSYFLGALYSLLIVIFGTFFMFNLILAVIISAFITLKRE
jgi:hypothetical protein